MSLDPKIWGPHYWFFLHTIAESYPMHPNDVTKKKYYDLIQNLPIFIPVDEIGNVFSSFLDKYPVTPYLTNRDSFVKWMHFIHNKVNVYLGKSEISLPAALELYRNAYKPKSVYLAEKINNRKHYLFVLLIIILFVLIYNWYE